MKITINMNNAETNAIEKITNKYAPMESDYIKIENTTENYKFGNSEIKRTAEGTDINVELKGDFVIEVIKFIDDIAAPVINAAKSLKFLFEGAKERFSKWAEDEEDVWQKIAKHLAETNPGESKIIGLIKHYDWVQINERTSWTPFGVTILWLLKRIWQTASRKPVRMKFASSRSAMVMPIWRAASPRWQAGLVTSMATMKESMLPSNPYGAREKIPSPINNYLIYFLIITKDETP